MIPSNLQRVDLAKVEEAVTLTTEVLGEMQTGALSVADKEALGAKVLRQLDMEHYKECLKRSYLDGPGASILQAQTSIEKAREQNLALPKALAPFAAIASTCHTLLFLDHFPRADTAQNQAALHAPPKGIALTARVARPHVVFATGRDHVVHSDGWLALRIIVLAIITLNGDERSRGMAALPCSRVRMTAMSWFLPQELGTLGCQIHVATKRVQVHGFNGGSGVAKLGIFSGAGRSPASTCFFTSSSV